LQVSTQLTIRPQKRSRGDRLVNFAAVERANLWTRAESVLEE
jgi:hypothetical protein